MLESTSIFKEKMASYGKQIDVLLEFDGITINQEKVKSAEQTINGEMFTSIMRMLELEVDKDIDVKTSEMLTVEDVTNMTIEKLHNTLVKYLTDISTDDKKLSEATEINVKLGVKLEDDEYYEYVDWGKFVVYDCEDSVDTNSYKLTLYDHLIHTHIKYDDDPLNLNYLSDTVTVGDLFQAICTKFGFTNMTQTFTNSSKIIHEDKYAGLGVTYRDILDEIAGVAGGFIKIFNKNIYVAYPTETGEVIGEDELKKLKVGKKVGPFNTVVLARSPQEDNIYYPSNIAKENRVAIRIDNNQIMDKNRSEFVVDLYNQINGFYYYTFEYECFGFGYFEFGDIITLVDLNGKEYKTIMMNIVDNINTGIIGKVYSDETQFSETKYEYASGIEKRLKNTEIICDKQNNKIALLTEQTTENTEDISDLTIEVGTIASRVENITDLTHKVTAYTTATLEEVAKGNAPLKLRIFGNNVFGTYESIKFQNGLYFQDGLYFGANQGASLKINNKVYVLGFNDVLRQLVDVCDEYVYDYSQGQAYVIRRIEADNDNNLSVRENEVIENLSMPNFMFDIDGNNTITLAKNANFEIEYMVKNDYTDTFASKVYMNSEISQTAQEIQESVTEQITEATGEIEENVATLTIKSNQIEQEVLQKVGESEIIAKLNVAVTEGQGIIELIGNIVKIISDNFTLTADGTITAQAGSIAGWNINSNAIFRNYTKNGSTYQCGIFSNNSSDEFIYAGVPYPGYLSEGNLRILKNGDMYSKNLNMLGNGALKIFDDDGVLQFQFNKDDFTRYNNVSKTNKWISEGRGYVDGVATTHTLWLYDAQRYTIVDGVHNITLFSVARYGDEASPSIPYSYFFTHVAIGTTTDNRNLFLNGYQITANTSDRRLKKNITDSETKALELIKKIHHVSFDWDKEKAHKEGHINIGYIAQELIKIDPNFVIYNKEFDTYQIDTLYVLSTATKAIQEQEERIEKIENENKELKETISELINRIEKLEGKEK